MLIPFVACASISEFRALSRQTQPRHAPVLLLIQQQYVLAWASLGGMDVSHASALGSDVGLIPNSKPRELPVNFHKTKSSHLVVLLLI